VGSKAAVNAKAAVAEEDAKRRRRETWAALTAVGAPLVPGVRQQRLQPLLRPHRELRAALKWLTRNVVLARRTNKTLTNSSNL
jgi:hypothetical protein